jgi:hypothetical protein
MPTVFRSMKAAADGLPVVGDQSKELGVRVPPNRYADIEVDDAGMVVLNGLGLSVVSNWRDLPDHLIPVRLSSIVPQAAVTVAQFQALLAATQADWVEDET